MDGQQGTNVSSLLMTRKEFDFFTVHLPLMYYETCKLVFGRFLMTRLKIYLYIPQINIYRKIIMVVISFIKRAPRSLAP